MSNPVTPEPVGTITITVMPDGALSISSEGVTPNAMLLAAAYLTRTANQMLDAQAYMDAQKADPKGLAVVRAMPEALRQ